MGWLRTEKATARAATHVVLELACDSAPAVAIDLSSIDSIGFVQIGDDLAPVHEGWWLLGRPDGVTALDANLTGLDSLMRDGWFAPLLRQVPEKFILFLMSRPWLLRGRQAGSGIVTLDTQQGIDLRDKGVVELVENLTDFPIIP